MANMATGTPIVYDGVAFVTYRRGISLIALVIVYSECSYDGNKSPKLQHSAYVQASMPLLTAYERAENYICMPATIMSVAHNQRHYL